MATNVTVVIVPNLIMLLVLLFTLLLSQAFSTGLLRLHTVHCLYSI